MALLSVVWIAAGGCGAGSQEKPSLVVESDGASALDLYQRGLNELELGNLDRAEQAFRLSLSVAGKNRLDFAPPHEGLARVYLKRRKFEEAEAEARHAQELDKSWTRVYWVLGKIAERQSGDEMALVHYQRGLIVSPGDPEITTAAVDLLKKMGREREARELQAKMRGAGGGGGEPPAESQSEETPGDSGTAGGSSLTAGTRARLEPFFPDQTARIEPGLLAVFQQEFLTRGALAVLITGDGEHGLAGALSRSGLGEGSVTPPSDVSGRPEQAWINRALAMGIMERFPDGTFRPDQKMTRLTLSLWIEETISRLRNNQRVFDLYRGQKSPFPDLPDGHYGLNAARIAIDLKLLALRSDGRFMPEEPVALDEGIQAILRLGPALLGQKTASR